MSQNSRRTNKTMVTPPSTPRQATQMIKASLQPWYEAIDNPAAAQQTMLHRLLQDYAKTDYGKQHSAAQIETLEEYRRAFPAMTYEDYKPLIQRVMSGEVSLLLCEEPVGWAITRGTPKESQH